MQEPIHQILTQQNILHHTNEGILICQVNGPHEGIGLTKALLYGLVDQKTALYLSGGKTPKSLYEKLALEEQLVPGAVGIVDERYGKQFHPKSNEKMLEDTGLLRYLQMRAIPFYPILQTDKTRPETAEAYDQQLRELHTIFPKSIALMGIGTDGHTSGIAPNRKDFTNPMFAQEQKHLLVSEFDDPKSFYGERVGMTFLGLSMMDLLLVLVIGDDKKEALDLLFTQGTEEEIPARFYKRPDVSQKTLIITDQQA